MVGLVLLCVGALSGSELPLSRLVRDELTCPVCRHAFAAMACVDANTRGGVDRDLFARSLGPQPEYYRIAACPYCGYSGYAGDFDATVVIPPDVRRKILKEPRLKLPPGFTPASDPRDLDATHRYALAITCYRWRLQSDEALAWLNLRASWIERDEGSILPPDPRLAKVMAYIERWRPPMRPSDNQVDVEMQTATRIAEAAASGRFNRYQRPYVDLALALILRSHGENRQAGPLLDRLLALDDCFGVPLREAIQRMRNSVDRERDRQMAAARHFEQALLAGQVGPDNEGPACYLLGELNRRLGRDGEAVLWFEKALANPALPLPLQTWARQQRAACADEVTPR